MKTGKRILSVLLAVLMLAATLTVAFAVEDDTEPLYVVYQLPIFDTWDPYSLDVYYQDDVPFEIYSFIKDEVFNDDYDIDDQTGMLVRYEEDDYQAFIKLNSDVPVAHQYMEWDWKTDPEFKMWHFASGKIDPNFLYVLADYNSPFYIRVWDEYSECYHQFEIKGLQYSSCRAESRGSYYCTKCQQTLPVTFPATHIYGEFVLRRETSCTQGSIISRYCARCNNVDTVLGKPREHKYPGTGETAFRYDETVAPTCFTKGYDKYVCDFCGMISMENYKDATNDHKDKNNDNHCDVCGTLMNKPQEQPEEEEKAPKKNIFQRIIDWFKNLFKKLFK